MPELPEVESVRRGLTAARLRSPIDRVWRSNQALRIGTAWREESLALLTGCTPGRIARRGKYLIWRFAGGDETEVGLLVHLGMSGRLTLSRPDVPLEPHTHLVVDFCDRRQVRFIDPRRFGGLRAAPVSTLYASPPLCDLGPEPLSRRFDADELAERAGRSTRALRDVLLDQRVVAGLGNIYVLEALFRARIHPLSPANRLRPSAWRRLLGVIREVLAEGIRNRGTTFRDFRDAHGRRGTHRSQLRVYGRAGQPCQECGAMLRGFVLGGRSGVYCPSHQPRSGRRWIS
jgi:formamidopyrimidine-DNA glycosylase